MTTHRPQFESFEPHLPHRVEVDTTPYEALAPDERRRMERTVLDTLARRLGPESVAQLEEVLSSPPRQGATMAFAAADPESATLFGALMSLRLAARAEEEREMVSRAADEAARLVGRQVTVRIAMLPELEAEDVRAVVVRRPGDGGQPLLLVRDSVLTAADLSWGLRAAVLLARRYGEHPRRERRLHLRHVTTAARTGWSLARTQRIVERLRRSHVHHIAGVGAARTLTVLADADE